MDTLKDHADAIRALGKQTLANVIEIGRRLTECKKIVGHGKWLPWLKREFGWTQPTAFNFMNVYELSQKSKLSTVGNLDLPLKSLYLLAAPSTPDAARDKITKRVASGDKIKHEEVVDMVREAKETEPSKPSGLRARVLEKINDAGDKGLICADLQKALSDAHPHTVTTTLNALVNQGAVRDSGRKRHAQNRGGRDSIVYVLGDPTAARPRSSQARAKPKAKSTAPRKLVHASAPCGERLGLTPEQVNPDFKGTPIEFTDQYGHVQVTTAIQRSTAKLTAWASNMKALVREGQRMPDWPEVQQHWIDTLTAPNGYDIAKLTEAMEWLRPKMAEAERVLERAVAVAKEKCVS